MLLPVVSYADTFSWEDEDGVHFVDDASKIPQKSRKKAQTREDMKTLKQKDKVNDTFDRKGFEGVLQWRIKFYEYGPVEYYYDSKGTRKFNGGGGYFVPVVRYDKSVSQAESNEVTIYCTGRLVDETKLLDREQMKVLKNRLCNPN
jgi:hypothetical protein